MSFNHLLFGQCSKVWGFYRAIQHNYYAPWMCTHICEKITTYLHSCCIAINMRLFCFISTACESEICFMPNQRFFFLLFELKIHLVILSTRWKTTLELNEYWWVYSKTKNCMFLFATRHFSSQNSNGSDQQRTPACCHCSNWRVFCTCSMCRANFVTHLHPCWH